MLSKLLHYFDNRSLIAKFLFAVKAVALTMSKAVAITPLRARTQGRGGVGGRVLSKSPSPDFPFQIYLESYLIKPVVHDFLHLF